MFQKKSMSGGKKMPRSKEDLKQFSKSEEAEKQAFQLGEVNRNSRKLEKVK